MPIAVVVTLDRFPHRCRTCGSGPEGPGREWWLDLGEVDNPPGAEGPASSTVYICNLCLDSAVVDMGYSTPTQHLEVLGRVAQLENSLFDVTVKADSLETGLHALLSARFIPDSADSRELVRSLEAPPDGEDGESSEGDRVDSGAGETPESGNVEGMGDLFSDDGADGSSLSILS